MTVITSNTAIFANQVGNINNSPASTTRPAGSSNFVNLLGAQSEPETREDIIERTNAEVKATRTEHDPIAEFKEFLEKTPAERMRELILKELGLTEESLASLPPKERQTMEEKIADMIEAKFQQQTEEKLEEYTLKAKIAQMSAEMIASAPIENNELSAELTHQQAIRKNEDAA